MLAHMAEHLARAGRIEIRDFGSFSLRYRSALRAWTPAAVREQSRRRGRGAYPENTGTSKRRRCCCDRCRKQPRGCMRGGRTMAELAPRCMCPRAFPSCLCRPSSRAADSGFVGVSRSRVRAVPPAFRWAPRVRSHPLRRDTETTRRNTLEAALRQRPARTSSSMDQRSPAIKSSAVSEATMGRTRCGATASSADLSSRFGSMMSATPTSLCAARAAAASTGRMALALLPEPVSPSTSTWRVIAARGTSPVGGNPGRGAEPEKTPAPKSVDRDLGL